MELVRTDYGVAVERPGAAPLPLRLILGIGRNYSEHAAEQGVDAPDRPMVFTKHPGSAILHGDDIIIPPSCVDPDTGGEQVDFEGELAVILAEPCRDVPEEQALSKVLGYCCANDVSARWWQKKGSGGQFIRGKSFDTFCPMGPRVTPASEVPDPQALRVVTRVSGDVMQDASTGLMMFSVATLIAELSVGTTLPAGTAILTGTPSGVGMARTPPRYLKPGDTVEIEIEGVGERSGLKLGRLKNAVVAGGVAGDG
ncbi:MAG: fumarylacetoacetate hydrolase family protein [Planctomycetota bacterium]